MIENPAVQKVDLETPERQTITKDDVLKSLEIVVPPVVKDGMMFLMCSSDKYALMAGVNDGLL